MNKRSRLVWVGALLAVLILAAACSDDTSDSGSSGGTTTTAANKGFTVQTPDGEVSLSLNGQLPPSWPATFPVPPGATPAGSGSLINSTKNTMVGVYENSGSAQDAYDFYKGGASGALTVENASSAGLGSAFVGNLKLGGAYAGSTVTIAAVGGKNLTVIVLQGVGGATTTVAGGSTTTTAGASTTTTTHP